MSSKDDGIRRTLVAVGVALLVAGSGIGLTLGVGRMLSGEPETARSEAASSSQPNASVPGGEAFGGIAPSPQPALSVYDTSPVPVGATAAEIEAALGEHARSLLFLGHSFGDTLRVDWDPVLLPNGFYAEGTLQWTSVLNDIGAEIMAASEQGKCHEIKQWPYTNLEAALADEDGKVARARGVLELKTPLAWRHVTLRVENVGGTRQDGDLSATLKAVRNDCFAVDISADSLDSVVFFARDRQGRRLERAASRRKRGFLSARVKGQVQAVEIYVPAAWHEASARVEAMGEPDQAKYAGPHAQTVPNPRYLPTGHELKFLEMTPERLGRESRVFSDRSKAMIGHNRPVIRVVLPPVDNSAFARAHFVTEGRGKLEVVDEAGRSIDYELIRGVFGDENGGFGTEIGLGVVEGKDPLSFHRVRGTVKVAYPARLRRVVLTPDRPSVGAIESRFLGNRVRLSGWRQPGSPAFNEHYGVLRAYGASGMRLVPLGGGWFLGGWGDLWGTVRKIEVLDVERWIEVAIPFDLKPAPLRGPWPGP